MAARFASSNLFHSFAKREISLNLSRLERPCSIADKRVFMLNCYRYLIKERANKAVKPGEAIVVDGVPHKVAKITQGKRGKGGGYVKALLRNLIDGQVFEKTFTSDETVELASLEKDVFIYSWSDGSSFHFMHATTFEEVEIPKDDISDWEFLVEGQEVKLSKFKDSLVGVELPKTYDFEVVSIDTQKTSSGFQCATISSGAEVFVPLFVTVGMKIKVNIQERQYIERSSEQN